MKKYLLFLACLIQITGYAQVFDWAKSIGGISSTLSSGITTDTSGNIFITGRFEGTADFDPGAGIYNMISLGQEDAFIEKLDASGNFLWAKSYNHFTDYDQGNSVAVDLVGNVYMTGSTGGMINQNIIIQKYGTAGNLIWSHNFGGSYYDAGDAIALDGLGNVYITGLFWGPMDFDPGPGVYNVSGGGFFLLKLNGAGNFQWVKTLPGADRGESVTIDALNNLYLTGSYSGAVDFDMGADTFIVNGNIGTARNIFVLKLNSSGDFEWVKSISDTNYIYGHDIAVDNSGGIYITGEFYDSADFDPGAATYYLTADTPSSDVYVLKLDSVGTFVWAHSMGSVGTDRGQSIATDSYGNVYTSGFFADTVDFDPGSGVSNLISQFSFGEFVQKLDSNGNFLFAYGISGSTVSSHCWSVCIDPFNSILTTGNYSNTGDFDPGNGTFYLTSQGGDLYIQKISQPVLNTPKIDVNNSFTISPNPTTSTFTITTTTELRNAQLEIFNVLGEKKLEIRNWKLGSVVDVSGFEEGIYFVRVSDGEKYFVKKLVVE